MAELNKGQLTAENTASFPNNTVGYITPTLLRTFNQNMIDSLVDEVTYNSDSASVSASISQLKNFSSSLDNTYATDAQLSASASTLQNNINSLSASVAVTDLAQSSSIAQLLGFSSSLDATFATDAQLSASASTLQNQINLKVNISQTSSMSVLSSSYALSASFSSTASYALNTQNVDTGSLVTTASFNAYTASATVTSASFNARINALDPSGSATSILALNQFTASQYVSNSLFLQSSQTSSLVTTSSFNSYTASASTNVSASINSATSSLSASLTLTDNSKLNTGSFNTYTASAATNVSGAINTATQSLSASLTTTINGISGKTGSFATTGSNTFIGNQIVSGNINVDGNITATSASFIYINTIYETASVIYSSGSNQFGDELSDVQTLSGSVKVQGGLTVNGINVLSSSVNEDAYLLTSSFNTYTASASTNVSASINSATSSLSQSLSSSIGALSASVAITDNGQDTKINSLISATGSYATTGSNNFIGTQNITGSLIVSGATFNAKIEAPTLVLATTTLDTLFESTASGVISQIDFTRIGAGPTGDSTGVRLQTISGSDTSGDTLFSRVTTNVNRHTTTAMTGSVVNTIVQSTWATGSGGTRVSYASTITANAQSASATITLAAGNGASNNTGGTASIAAGLIRIGTHASQTISSTGSFGAMILVAPLNTPALSIRSGSFELTTPQGSGSFYSNCPITSSGLRINGTAIVKDLIISGTWGGSGSGSLFVENNTDIASISSSRALSITGSAPTIQSGSLSGSLISNLGDIYTGSNNANFVVTLGSASMAHLLTNNLTQPNTLYFVI